MKTTRTVFAFLLLLIGGLAVGSAFAAGPHGRGGHGGGHWHGSVGVYFGAPFFGYGYGYGYPYYYAPYYYPSYSPAYYPPVQQAPVYVEQGAQPAPSAQPALQPSAPAGYWYYCADSRAYYPYVKECPSGWQRVAPQPG